MLVMILERVPPGLRGELTRWLIEPHTGTFVGHVSALVRDKLWWKCVQSQEAGGVIQIWSTNTEQRFAMRKAGDTDRRIVDFDGIQLIRIPHATKASAAKATDPVKPARAGRKNGNLRIVMPPDKPADDA
jgi:CRISPR-associated protein Cas2